MGRARKVWELGSRAKWVLPVILTLGSIAGATERPTVRVGIVTDGPWIRADQILGVFEAEIVALLERDYAIELPPGQALAADWTPEGVERELRRLLAEPEVDVVLAMGAIATHVACRLGELSKPVIAPFALDIELQSLPFHEGASGVRNLNYLTATSDFESQVRAFREVVPFRNLAMLSNPHYALVLSDRFKVMEELGVELGFELTIIPVEQSADSALGSLPDDVDAVLVAPLLHLSASELNQLIASLIERKLPSFSVMGGQEVERGILAGLTPESDWQRIARRVALNIERALLGEDPASMPVQFELRERLSLNMATARAIGVYPRWAVLTEAILLDDAARPGLERRLTLEGVVAEALAANLALVAEGHVVAAGRQQVRAAKAALRPQLSVDVLAVQIDSDRAEASLGAAAERTLDASATIRQLVFSDGARANVDVQLEVQRSREAERQRVYLDTVQAAIRSYLDVLRAKTLEGVRKQNLKLTRSNLELARIRRNIGMSGPGEVYRWESQIATDRSAVIGAQADRNLAEIQLNRLLHRPSEESFKLADVSLDDMNYIIANNDFIKNIDNPWSFDMFRDFMVEIAAENAPELEQIDAAFVAQRRVLRAARRAPWSPTVAVQGTVEHTIDRGGAGAGGGGASFPFEIPSADDTDWSVALSVGFAPFSGGAKRADIDRAAEELSRLEIERAAVRDQIEQRVRSAVHVAWASFAKIGLARDAAGAADKNLELVQDGYSRGAVSVLELLDAQSAALVARLVASNAVYDYIIELAEVERAAGRFSILSTDGRRAAFVERLRRYVEAARLRDGR